jgi:Leucine-rich repeat (LRR) protein
LTHLDLSSNQITDISPLTSLVNLTYLNLSFNDIKDISPLLELDLSKLKHINLYKNWHIKNDYIIDELKNKGVQISYHW